MRLRYAALAVAGLVVIGCHDDRGQLIAPPGPPAADSDTVCICPPPDEIDNYPSWAPDGTRIAFTHRFSQVRILDLNTSATYALTPGFDPSWSPDGQKIAYVYRNNIYVIDLTTLDTTRVTTWGSCYFPTWSPDGTQIAYDVIPPVVQDSCGIWSADLRTGVRKHLLSSDARQPRWSPDGERIAFIDAVGQQPVPDELLVLCLGDSSITRLTSNEVEDRRASWSHDGKRLAWSVLGDGRANPVNGIWTLNADGTAVIQLPSPAASWTHAYSPDWSPACSTNMIVFSGYNPDSNSFTLWLMNADGTNRHRLTNPEP